MYVTLVQVQVRDEYVEAFVEACRKNHEYSITESGSRRFDILQDASTSSRFILYEAYANAEAAAAHKQTAHYLEWRDAVADMMAAPRRSEVFHGLFPRD